MAEYGGIIDLIPGIAREDADMILKLIVNGRILYRAPVNDPIFSAHKERTMLYNNGQGSGLPAYLPDVCQLYDRQDETLI